MQYIKYALYYYGPLDDDQIVSWHSQSELEDEASSSASELVKKLERQTLEETKMQVSNKTVGNKIDLPKNDTTQMEVEESIQKPLQGETVPLIEDKSVATNGITSPTSAHNDSSDVEMKNVNIDILNVSDKGEDDRLHLEDFDKYTGSTKFNSKSFKAGYGQGTISMTKSSFELLFTQVKIVMDKIFKIIPLSRYNHLVGCRYNHSKVWPKQDC